MRYYSIVVTNVSNTPEKTGVYKIYNSQIRATGQPDMGALNVELDLPVTVYALAENTASVRIWGISLDDITQSANMIGMQMDVFGGMQKGLPLANPQQAGLLLHGRIFQCFSNWIGNAMTLDFVVSANIGSVDFAANIVLNWEKGQKLADALTATLTTAYPDFTIDESVLNINENLVLPNDEPGYFATLTQFSQYIKTLSKAIINQPDYNGVDIKISGSTLYIYDSAIGKQPKKILFTDLIGQPARIDSVTIQLYLAMRGDIQIGDLITLPVTPLITTPASLSQFPVANRNGSIFQGTFFVQKIRHVGNFRSPNPLDWMTIIDCSTYMPKKQKTATVTIGALE